ncbi:hypothetical protein A2239_01455, partial [Candidatus Uhrbacteria bacterium RIFOXYA2_FULL_40_9]
MNHPLLEVKNLTKSFGNKMIIDGLSFVISEGQKIGFIGRNGSGKSTLFRIITGEEEQDAGEVILMPRTQLGYVVQHTILPKEGSVLTYLEERSGKPSWKVKKIASQFGLKGADLDKVPNDLSGGYQMRVKLIDMFLKEPNLLLLDEPVNYLDLSTLLLLERFLKTYQGSFILIAHDREFLQNTCEETYEIEQGELVHYRGPVEDYLVWKQEQKEFQLKTNKKLAREMAHHQTFVDRFRYKASLATRAQSKIKHIEKLRRKLITIDQSLATSRICIASPSLSPGPAVETEHLTIGYPHHTVAQDISFEISRGEKIVIVGENGRGKSTLLKTLAGVLPSLSGKIKWWHQTEIGYYDQKIETTLKEKETVLHYLMRMAPPNTAGEQILMMAGNFLFRNDDLEKPTSVLSGGERARLCLAGVLLHKQNTLILDEPTNHLDVETAEALALALKQYQGTVIFVSHARTFVHAIADRVFEVRAGSVRLFYGTYEEYITDLENRIEEEREDIGITDSEKSETSSVASCADLRFQLKTLRRAQQRTEKKIDVFEKEKSELLAYFFENPMDYAPEKSQRLSEIEEELSLQEKEWIRQEAQIEENQKE